MADTVVALNEVGVYTTGSCCGHGKGPTIVAIYPSAMERARELGYEVVPPTATSDPYIVLAEPVPGWVAWNGPTDESMPLWPAVFR